MLLYVYKLRKGINAKCLYDMYSVKQINYAMCQSVKFVQPQRKTTTVGLKTVLGAKLWYDSTISKQEVYVPISCWVTFDTAESPIFLGRNILLTRASEYNP